LCAGGEINPSVQAQPVRLPARQADRSLDLLHGGEELLVQGSALAVEISPQWGRILLAG